MVCLDPWLCMLCGLVRKPKFPTKKLRCTLLSPLCALIVDIVDAKSTLGSCLDFKTLQSIYNVNYDSFVFEKNRNESPMSFENEKCLNDDPISFL